MISCLYKVSRDFQEGHTVILEKKKNAFLEPGILGPFKHLLYCKNFTTTTKGDKCLKSSPKLFILILSADRNDAFQTDQIYLQNKQGHLAHAHH